MYLLGCGGGCTKALRLGGSLRRTLVYNLNALENTVMTVHRVATRGAAGMATTVHCLNSEFRTAYMIIIKGKGIMTFLLLELFFSIIISCGHEFVRVEFDN